tara:strand:+ start:132 stop:1133 length:1002 start_codon:yes stop_codon:yes gene_type:complete
MKIILIFLSGIFNFITSIRNLLYDHQFISIHQSNIPIISIGNLELGGTGKTPLVIYLCHLLIKNNFKPGIISRGYKRKSTGRQLVSNGHSILLNQSSAGDEPYFLAKSLNNVPIIVDKNRVNASSFISKNFDVNVIILDDAFQHRKINRTIDIVLLNINTPPNKLKLFPLGTLRENIKNVSRADILLITKKNTFTDQKNLDYYKNLYFHNKFFTQSNFLIINPITKKELQTETLKNTFIFCGIGDPKYLKNILKSLKIDLILFKTYADHHDYDKNTLNELSYLIKKNNVDNIITTEKDYVKLPKSFCETLSIKIIKMSFLLNDDFDELVLKML